MRGRDISTTPISLSRLAALVAVAGLAGGLFGGALVLAFDSDPPPAVQAIPPTPPPSPPSEAERMRDAIRRVLPAVVTVIADLPPESIGDGLVRERQQVGSGIVVSESGLVLTNFHVIDGAAEITVALSTAERRPARLVADDSPFSDVAFLSIAPGGLRVASFGDSDALVLGDAVAAIGGGLVTFENHVKTGIVSARHARFPKDGLDLLDLLETDAAVNHGDSGGALINIEGEVVGLLTTVVRESEGFTVEGVALAQSSNSLVALVAVVATTGINPRPRIGIERVGLQHRPIVPDVAEAEGLPVGFGALVVAIGADSPAQAAGVEVGDIVVGVNGIQIDADYPLVNLLRSSRTGEELELFVLRGDEQVIVRVVPQIFAGGGL